MTGEIVEMLVKRGDMDEANSNDLDGALFMWADHFFRRYRLFRAKNSTDTLTPNQIENIYSHIQRTKAILDASGDETTHEGFHEAASLSIKLWKFGIPAPFNPAHKERVESETFNEDFLNYLAAIAPYVRDGDIKTIKFFSESAIDILYSRKNESIGKELVGEPPSPQAPEAKKPQ